MFAKPGGVLEGMQTLKQSRLSVSKVTKKQWDFVMSLAEEEMEPEASAQNPVGQDVLHETEVQSTEEMSATDNFKPATTGGDDNSAGVHSNGV